MKKTSDVDWNDEVVPDDDQQKAFEILMDRLISLPGLVLPTIGIPCMIHYDSSQNAIEVVLL